MVLKKGYIVLTSLLCLVNCSDYLTDEGTWEIEDSPVTRSFYSLEEIIREDTSVSRQDIDSYLLFKTIEARCNKQELKVINVEEYLNDGEITCYLIQYSKGWEIISADKRGPIVLACSERGDLKSALAKEPISLWIDCLSEDVVARRRDSSYYDRMTPKLLENESTSLEFWKIVTADKDYLEAKRPQTRFIDDPPFVPQEYWQIYGVSTTEVTYEYVPHLTQTRWHQHAPFNHYCPFGTDPDEADPRVRAGCTAIAGAQMLYYLHNETGVPDYGPAYATSYGNLNGFQIEVGGLSDTIWNDMVCVPDGSRSLDATYNDPAAVLVTDVILRLPSTFYNDRTSGDPADLVDNVFGYYGIVCERVRYSPDSFLVSLRSGVPAIMSAETAFLFGTGHTFLADGYKTKRNMTTVYYQWMSYDEATNSYVPIDVFKTEIQYSSPILNCFYMNWGEKEDYSGEYNDIACSPSGSWMLSNYDFDYWRKMIYNFRPV